MQMASWFMFKEPQDPAKQGMHLQLTEKGAHAGIFSYLDKGVIKQNVKGKKKNAKNKAQISMLSIEGNSCGINHAFSGEQILVPGRGEQKHLRYYIGTSPSKRPWCTNIYTV